MMELKQVGQGRTATILAQGTGAVIKLFKEGFSAEAVEKEFQISRHAHALGIATPRPGEITHCGKRLAIVFQRVPGKTMLADLASRPWRVRKHAINLAGLHRQIHMQKAGAGFPRQLEVLAGFIQRAPLLSPVEKRYILGCLEGLPPGDRLCHGDFHPDNILLGEKPWVIDWQNGAGGNPAGDVARTLVLLTTGALPRSILPSAAFAISYLRRQMKNAYFRHYCREMTIGHNQVGQWLLPVAAARLAEQVSREEQQALIKLIRFHLPR